MTTVFLRAGTQQPTDDTTPHTQALVDICSSICARPVALYSEPLLVSTHDFDKAEKEMMALLMKRGWHIGGDVLIQRADMPERNFLLFGVPVVCRE